MEFSTHKENISVYETAFQGSAEHAVDCDITLPEYLPDIVRILRCSAVPGVHSHQVTGDRITAECDCIVRVLYICEQGKIRCFEQTLNFSKQIELKNSENVSDIFVGAKTEYINYRVSGQRSFEVHGALTVFARGNAKKRYEPVSSTEGGNVTARCENMQVCDLISITEKSFSVSETCETGSVTGAIGAVIAAGASAVIDEVKVISDKLFLKGELIVRTICTQQESCEVMSMENIIGINQIIEAPDITEDCDADVELSVAALDVRSRFDSAGDKTLLDVAATVNVSAYGYQSRQITVIKDAYSTKYETELKKTGIYINSLEEKLEDTFLCRGTADLSTTGMTKILSFMCGDVTAGFSVREDSIAVSGEITADIIYEDAKGEIAFAQRQIPYEYKRQLHADDTVLTCRPCCSVRAYSFVMGEGNQLDARIELTVRGFVFRETEKNVVTDINIDKSRMKNLKTASLTIYFADGGENLWDIAEHFNTTVDAIMRDNHIQDGVIEKKCKLLIPKV